MRLNDLVQSGRYLNANLTFSDILRVDFALNRQKLVPLCLLLWPLLVVSCLLISLQFGDELLALDFFLHPILVLH